jgi:hypothetical protein
MVDSGRLDACIHDRPEAGAAVGPCSDGACPTGASCLYRIGNCASLGECIETPLPACMFERMICGCGPAVLTGCPFYGYATGPTTGAPCDD